MGPSFGKIAEIALPAVLMTWKICLLRCSKTFLGYLIDNEIKTTLKFNWAMCEGG